METFLSGGGPILAYDIDLEVDGPAQVEVQEPNHVLETNQPDTLFGEQLYRPVEEDHGKGHSESFTPESDDLKRQHYLQRFLTAEKRMQKERSEMQQRIDTMKQILVLKNPMEQLSAYLALRQESQFTDNMNAVEDLVLCAKRMTNEEDNEVAMLGAFAFIENRRRHLDTRGMGAMMPVVAAMMEKLDPVNFPGASSDL